MIETILAWAYLDAGEDSRALDSIEGAVPRARAQGERLPLTDALWVRARVLERVGRLDDAAAVLTEGLELAQSLPYPYAEARILEQMGRIIDEALAIFRRLGAERDVERIEGQETPKAAPVGER